MAVWLKFFRSDHGRDEIRAEREGNDSEDDVFHKIFRLKFFAADRVKCERGEEHDGRSDVNGIEHNYSNTQRRRDERDNAATVLLGVNLRPRTSRIRGSPFQLPTRLAVGLGLESGLETSCLASFAPSSLLRILGLPHPAPERKPDFGCNGTE
jgi:hypothetical protein